MLAVVGVLGGALVGCAGDARSSPPPTVTRDPATTEAAAKRGAGAELAGTVFADIRFGFNFRYPPEWREGEFAYDPDQTAGVQPAASAAIGFDEDNSVFLTRYDLAQPVGSAELPDQLNELNGVITRFAGETSSGTMTEIGGLPAVTFEEFALQDDPDDRRSRVVFLFDGKVEYEVNCQSTPDGRDEMSRGCDQILSTLGRK
ncbi:MAG: hypothetical protein ACR2HV_09900 [Acidimicrobiales bacterium]